MFRCLAPSKSFKLKEGGTHFEMNGPTLLFLYTIIKNR